MCIFAYFNICFYRFRVVNETFVDTTPNGPPKRNDGFTGSSVALLQTKDEQKCPYSITGSINEPGLGLISWWKT